MEIVTKNAKETQKLGPKISNCLKPSDLVCFYGELGAGKTTLIQAIAKALGVEKRVVSPTFTIAKEYKTGKDKIKTVYHIDLYRIEDKDQAEAIGIKEMATDPFAVVFIEWPEKIEEILPEKRVNIRIGKVGEETRKITIENLSL